MRVFFKDSDFDKSVMEVCSVDLVDVVKDDEVHQEVWIYTFPEEFVNYYCDSPEIVDNYDRIADTLLQTGYADLTDYVFTADYQDDE